MERIYNETDITWSSIEKNFEYGKVNWVNRKNGIPMYILYDNDGKKLYISIIEEVL